MPSSQIAIYNAAAIGRVPFDVIKFGTVRYRKKAINSSSVSVFKGIGHKIHVVKIIKTNKGRNVYMALLK